MTTARILGLPAAHTEYAEFDGEPAVVVTRFDRQDRGERVVRAHQEDTCMALSIARGRKYEEDGGPGVARIIDLLRGSTDTTGSVERFVDAVAFNYLVGASDAHAKNYSIMLRGRNSTLAPLYDLASSLPYEAEPGSGLRTTAMAIGGERRFGRVRRLHWDRLARRANIDADRLWLRVSELAERLPDALASAIGATLPVRPGATCPAAIWIASARTWSRRASLARSAPLLTPGRDESPAQHADDQETPGDDDEAGLDAAASRVGADPHAEHQGA